MGSFIGAFVLILMAFVIPVLLLGVLIVLPIWFMLKNSSSDTRPITLPKNSKETKEYPVARNIQKKANSSHSYSETVKGKVSSRMFWAGQNDLIEVASYIIREPLIYWTDFNKCQAEQEASCILKNAKVSPSIPEEIESLGYWPTYSKASPNQRAYYLNWLANGKNKPLEEIGYAFLYFYGLERRALVEQKDISLIISETLRLLDVYQNSNSFNSYLSSFITYLVAREQANGRPIEASAILTRLPNTNNEILLEIKLLASMGENPIIGAQLAYEITKFDQRASNSVVVKRVNEQFRQLFEKSFSEIYPNGLELSASSKRNFRHHPASPSLIYHSNAWETITVPNILGNKKLFTPLIKVWNENVEELRPLSSIAQKGLDFQTREAFRALPENLKSEVDRPDKPKWESLILKYTREDGLVLVPISQIVQTCINSKLTKITLKQSKDVAQTADDMGLSIVPDARHLSRSYGWDSLVALLKKDQTSSHTPLVATQEINQLDDILSKFANTDFNSRCELLPNNVNRLLELKAQLQTLREKPDINRSEKSIYNKLIFAIDKKMASRQGDYNYELALVILELGMVVSAADGTIDPVEIQYISEFLESQFRLSQHEIQKLEAYREILKLQPPNLSSLIRKLKSFLTLEQIELILRLLLGIAASNGIVEKGEIVVLKKIYTSLGIATEKLNTVLWQLQSDEEKPVIVQQGIPRASGEIILPPEKGVPESKVKLNEAYLREILDETNKVTSILANALIESESEDEEDISSHLSSRVKDEDDISTTEPSILDGPLSSLDSKHRQVLTELSILSEWDKQEFHSLAKKHGLMPASMIEIINTWSDEHLGDFLIEEGIYIIVNTYLLENVE